MSINDERNLLLATSQSEVDEINGKFYSRFNFPWYPHEFTQIEAPQLYRKMLCQDIGDWKFERVPSKMRILVAGCGTNQAVFTALKYPEAEILGIDVSLKSIEISKDIAKQLGIKNLNLEVKSINKLDFSKAFDYIICTGVIHHNADPAIALSALTEALDKNGIIELMVYNYYHRILTTACQKAIRKICQSEMKINSEMELNIARKLMNDFHVDNIMKQFLLHAQQDEEAAIADSMLQPVEHSYTIDSFNELVSQCGLEIMSHCINQWDADENHLSWNLDLPYENYKNFPDIERWQIGNLLMLEKSPLIWFYLQKKDSDFTRISEKSICEKFLETTFLKSSSRMYRYILSSKGVYTKNTQTSPFPSLQTPRDGIALKVFNSLSPDCTMKDVVERLGIDNSFNSINRLRINLTTTAFPYCIAKC